MQNPPPATPAAGADHAPFLSVIRGNPTAEEVAALTVVLTAKARGAAAATAAMSAASGGAGSSAWSAKSRLMREPVSPGPGGWKRSALPR
jgi:hypothetical protein